MGGTLPLRKVSVAEGKLDATREGVRAMPDRLSNAIIILVAVVWAANFIAPIFMSGFEPKPELNVAFMAILGVLTASKNRKRDEGSKGGGKSANRKKAQR